MNSEKINEENEKENFNFIALLDGIIYLFWSRGKSEKPGNFPTLLLPPLTQVHYLFLFGINFKFHFFVKGWQYCFDLMIEFDFEKFETGQVFYCFNAT